MYLLSQTLIYLALALIVGGAIGFAWRSCLADPSIRALPDDARDLAPQRDPTLPGYTVTSHTVDMAEQPARPLVEAAPAARLSDLSSRDLEAVLADAAPGRSLKARFGADDLTTIMGITPQIDAWLARHGITRFSHIANLTAEELYWLVENLPGNGASVYDHQWVAQAARLDRGKS
jgi:predicted flap endonuclease-1-like 5' DNA nuclease